MTNVTQKEFYHHLPFDFTRMAWACEQCAIAIRDQDIRVKPITGLVSVSVYSKAGVTEI
jgi:hypothetical protein